MKSHPAAQWSQDAQHPQQDFRAQLRLAAMAGHMQVDKIAARRAALIDLLADGRPHPREELWAVIAAQLSPDCWGKLPQEALARDLRALRRGGLRIGYSRRAGAVGYYLEYPPIARTQGPQYETVNWALIRQIRRLSIQEKNQRAFAAADFALRQKQLILTEEHPDWSLEEVNQAARQQVFGRLPEAV